MVAEGGIDFWKEETGGASRGVASGGSSVRIVLIDGELSGVLPARYPAK
jgi:hypothetical protein